MPHFLSIVLATIAALFPIVDPIGTVPMFMAITKGDCPIKSRQQARMGSIYMVVILITFLLFGGLILSFFGISMPGLRIAGGILVCRFGIDMLYPHSKDLTAEENTESAAKRDISLFPLAIPYLSGPGAIAVTISLVTLTSDWVDYIAIIIGISITGIITYLFLRSSEYLKQLLGITGMNVMTKLFGFIIFCIGVQFVVTGVTDDTLLTKIASYFHS